MAQQLYMYEMDHQVKTDNPCLVAKDVMDKCGSSDIN